MLTRFLNRKKICWFLIVLLFYSVRTSVWAQTVKPFKDGLYKLEKRLRQHGSTFRFWRGQTDSTTRKLIIERIHKGAVEIPYEDFTRDGKYAVRDVDGDSYKDFITCYHDFEEVRIYDTITKTFTAKVFYIPQSHGTVDVNREVLWAYREAQYGEPYPYSLLYTFKNHKPYFFYKLLYVTHEDHDSKKDAVHIELYRFNKNNYNDTSFVQNIKTTIPHSFDAERYWKQHYKKLLLRY